MTSFGENIWLQTFPLKLLGADLHRVVTVIRLAGGDLVIHSTAPFSAADVTVITALGRPAWLLDSMLRHDTFAREGHAAFPAAEYLAPPAFAQSLDFPVRPLLPAPAAWGAELAVLLIEGMPAFEEYVFFHPPSRTLILADLAFNFGPDESLWTKFLLLLAIGPEHAPGMSRPFKSAIKDKAAFQSSIAKMLAWDFDRVIVGHGDPIPSGGKAKLTTMLQRAGF